VDRRANFSRKRNAAMGHYNLTLTAATTTYLKR
jgi:hypothetical protein